MRISCFQLPELERINHPLSRILGNFVRVQCVLCSSLASCLGCGNPSREKLQDGSDIGHDGAARDPLVQDLAG